MKVKKSRIDMKKLLVVILTISIIATSFSSVVQISAQTDEELSSQASQVTTLEDGGMQTASRPVELTKEFMISNETNFDEFMTKPEHWESNVKVNLTCNIDIKGKAFNPIKEFSGIFDGCGYNVSNLKIQNKSSKSKNSELAFINTLNEFSEIKNITFDNYTIEGKSGVKKLAGLAIANHGNITGVNIKDSSINNIDKKANAAGYVLNNEENGIIENCFLENMSVKDTMIKAGFVLTNLGKIANSSTTLSVSSKDIAGGFCGINSGEIIFCKAEGNVIAKAKSKKTVTICSGFVGENSGIIKDSSSTGKVEGQEFSGGFVGVNRGKGEISSCQSIGDVESKTWFASIHCGGFAGYDEGNIKDCIAKGKVKGTVDSELAIGITAGVILAIIAASVIVFLVVRNYNKSNQKNIDYGNFDLYDDNNTNKSSTDNTPKKPPIYITYEPLIKDESIINQTLTNALNNEIASNTANGFLLSENQKFIISLVLGIAGAGALVGGGTAAIAETVKRAVRGYAYMGGFVGYSKGYISGCSVDSGLLKAKTLQNKYNRCGGFVGTNIGTIENSNTIGNEIHNKVYTGGYLGGFVGENFGKIESGTTTISVTNGKCTGGFCGNNSGEITNSKAEGNAIANAKTVKTKCGGFVGNNEEGKISDCASTGNVTGQEYVGGFCGDNIGDILKSKAKGNVTSSTKVNINRCGGFVGENNGDVKECISTGNAIGEKYVGGFAGVNKRDIINCNAHGKVTAKAKINNVIYPFILPSSISAGGFVGKNEKGTITNCTETGGADARSTSGQAKAGGFAGINKANIISSKASGYVYLSAGTCQKDDGCGGFVGRNDKNGIIDGCYAECMVETTNKKKGGSFVGEAVCKSTIKDSKCKSKIITKSGIRKQKKFYGHKDKKAIIENCYAN